MLALKPHHLEVKNFTCEYHMVPVGQFQQSDYPVSELSVSRGKSTASTRSRTKI